MEQEAEINYPKNATADIGMGSSALPGTRCSLLLSYILSGWAFFIPYLAAYLFYAWCQWPVHPLMSGGWLVIPCLLHVFWAIHVIHFALGTRALLTWRQSPRHCTRPLPAFWRLAPWLLLALFISIPGLYLEFPSDPTAHLARIVEWSQTTRVSEGGSWLKASYFMAYSVASIGPQNALEPLLTVYYTAICLLLSWQHYRLALEMKLETPAAFLFAALQLIVYGNSVFSYHRYYGLSSTIVSQIASVAILRIVLHQFNKTCWTAAFGRTLLALLGLLVMIVFNHIQGLLITAVGLAAVGLWWLSRHYRSALIVLGAGAAAGSLALLAKESFKPSKSLTILQESGWLNTGMVFNLFEASSPAMHRVLELIGTFGIGSSLLALLMLRRNHPGAWLMIVPLAFLLIPVTASPLALYLMGEGPGLLLSFHNRGLEQMSVFSRQLFAMPLALPVAWLFSELLQRPRWVHLAPLVPLATIGILLSLPSTGYNNARLWQALTRTPDDLELGPIRRSVGLIRGITNKGDEKKIIGGNGISHLLGQMGARAVPYSRRLILYPETVAPAQDQQVIGEYLNKYGAIREFLVVVPSPSLFFSPSSQTAQLSHHWLPQEVALNTVGSTELAQLSRKASFRTTHPHPWLDLMTNIPQYSHIAPSSP